MTRLKKKEKHLGQLFVKYTQTCYDTGHFVPYGMSQTKTDRISLQGKRQNPTSILCQTGAPTDMCPQFNPAEH